VDVDEQYELTFGLVTSFQRSVIKCKKSGFKSRSFDDLQDGIGMACYLVFTQMSFALLDTDCLCCPEAL